MILYFLYVFSSFFWVYLMWRVSHQLGNGKRKSIDFNLKYGLDCWRCKSEMMTFDDAISNPSVSDFIDNGEENYSLCTQCRRDRTLEKLVGKYRFQYWKDRFDLFIVRKDYSKWIFLYFIILSLIFNLGGVFVGQPIRLIMGVIGVSFLHIGNWTRWYYLIRNTKKTNH
jgi:hypothetical protein